MKMRKLVITVVVLTAFLAGVGVATFAGKKKDKGGLSESIWQGKEPREAAEGILDIAKALAGDGSWENIHVARVYYLSGRTAEAEPLFQRFQKEPGDLIRIGRVYAQAGDWDKAKPLFDRILDMEPKDEDWLAEIGAYYNLNGDRAGAEALFARSFAISPKSLKNALAAAGSYVNVDPRRR